MKMPIASDALVAFLVRAKRRTYAAQGDDTTVPPLLPGSRQLEYREGTWLYRDVYFGVAHFVGQETVYNDTSPVWAMCYAGGLVAAAVHPPEGQHVYEFLRAALRQVAPERPYRGPVVFREGAYVYTSESQGDIERFYGIETIVHDSHRVYQLRYSGGMLR